MTHTDSSDKSEYRDRAWLEVWRREVQNQPGEKRFPIEGFEFPQLKMDKEFIDALRAYVLEIRAMNVEVTPEGEHADTAPTGNPLS